MKTENKKTIILDTTKMIDDPNIFYKLGDANIIVPIAAVKEIDGLKKSSSDLVSKAAREVSRLLDRVSSYSDMTVDGGKVSSGARIFIETNYEKVEGLDSEGDRKIVGTALYLKRKGVKNLVLATTDTNMRIVGRAYGIKVEYMPYEADNIELVCKPDCKIDKDLNSPKRKHVIMNNTAKPFNILFWLIITILISIFVLISITEDTFTGMFFGLIMGGMFFMVWYAVYLRIINKKIPAHLPYKSAVHNYNMAGNNSDDLWDTPFSGNPYFDSTNRGN